MANLAWTLGTIAALGGTALADDFDHQPGVDAGVSLAVETHGSNRGVAQDYLVLPSGGELTAAMRFVTSEPSLGGEALRFSDVGLFDLAGRWSLLRRLEISASVTLLPKQPSYTDEKPWQSVGVALRTPLGKHAALAISGGGGHLMAHEGMWTREALTLEWRKPIADVLSFGISGGLDGLALTAPRAKSAFFSEVAVSTSALFREPSGHWGGWVGIGYAVPVTEQGTDPTTGLEVDPQPRLDFRIGSVLSLVPKWDLYAEYAIVDRGDLSNAATRLPILDGGFDQHQIVFGVTRHLEGAKRRPHDDDALQLGMR